MGNISVIRENAINKATLTVFEKIKFTTHLKLSSRCTHHEPVIYDTDVEATGGVIKLIQTTTSAVMQKKSFNSSG
ncbi:MAG: hypothetical protein VX597_03545 [Pseudomonadota bacterium]|nr:hypothetical protein [Pseudomonadota bacterium]